MISKKEKQAKDDQVVEKRTASEAGWSLSRYNLNALVPGKNVVAIANLFKGTFAEYSPLELFLLSKLDELDEHHPIIERFAKRGIITRVDELAALEMMGRVSCAEPRGFGLTICPTMACNFDCTYCFEKHRSGKMSPEVQNDVVNLARRLLKACGGKHLPVTWFGGEPMLAVDLIESMSERLMALAEEFGAEYSATIVTNGYLLTQENINILNRCKITLCQITIDGLGEMHDATRHLAGGGATFDRIIGNLRNSKIPFRICIRQNVQESNFSSVPKVKEFIEMLAEESGNSLFYEPNLVRRNKASEERGTQSTLLCGTDSSDIGIMRETGRFSSGRGYYCGASGIWFIVIDENGNLFKCWESIGDPTNAFATVHDWDPNNPLDTAYAPDKFTMYVNTSLPTTDKECLECIWLPMCVGGCPYHRLHYEKVCFPFKNQPEKFVLALHDRLQEQKRKKSLSK